MNISIFNANIATPSDKSLLMPNQSQQKMDLLDEHIPIVFVTLQYKH